MNNLPENRTINHTCSQRLSCLAGLAGGIIHELHNALGAISSNVKALQLRETQANTEHLAYMQHAIDRMHDLGQMLTRYTRDALVELEPVPVRKIFEETVALLQHEPEYQSIHFTWQRSLTGRHCALTNEDLLRRALEAILRNACEALATDKQDVTLALTDCKHGECLTGTIRLGCLDPATAYICCHIRDTGSGIPAGSFPMIFDPFYTTKMRARGVGLAHAVGLVLQTNAALCCQSTPEEGTCFTLCLPVA